MHPNVRKDECSGPASVVRGGMPPARDHNVPQRCPEVAGRTEACSEDRDTKGCQGARVPSYRSM